jgi:hypothetical protein
MSEDEVTDDYDEYFIPEPIEDWCDDCQEWFEDYWCEYCGYHGHNCPPKEVKKRKG